MATIRIPEPLRKYTTNNKKFLTHERDAGSALNGLTKQYPQLEDILFDDEGLLQLSLHIFLNKKDIRSLQGLETPFELEDTLVNVMSISGSSFPPYF
jgi:hypothetical protein